MPIGYAKLGEIVGKTVDEVKKDRDAGIINLVDFESLVRYVATYWGWGPKEDSDKEISELKNQVLRLKLQIKLNKPDGSKLVPIDTEPNTVSEQYKEYNDLSKPTVRWKVVDNKPSSTDDPYLDRIKNR